MRIVGFTDLRPFELEAPLSAMDAESVVVSLDSDASAFERAVSQFRRGRAALRGGDTDALVVYNGSGMLGIVAVVLSLLYGVPLVVRANGDLFRQHDEKRAEYRRANQWARWLGYLGLSALTRATFRYADGFVAVSESLAETLARRTSCPRERIRVVAGPVTPSQYRRTAVADGTSDATGTMTVLTVTNLQYHGKYLGVCRLVDAMVELGDRRDDVSFVVAGDGLYYDAVEQYIDERVDDDPLDARIHTLGFVSDVAGLYASSDLFAYVSEIDAYPNVVIEAQAAGLPVVASRGYGIDEQIADGETGVLVDADDSTALASTLDDLLSDADRRHRLGTAAAARVAERNAPETLGPQMQRALEAILARCD
ncbi:glycosyltransferase family 4 protein [Haloprofundus halophilus]|uniref:glycosyltransferase family 4 protein n=1 Tax=Haloprofundus halophilus TaxID=2283527 RepID=UPI0018E501F5|nr:glycosyltransferase family 4 protein [Haloprofundus halophilus]